MAFTTRLKVRFYELDPYNHVNHSAYVQYFESARIELLAAVGVDLAELKDRGFHLVVTDLHISYRQSAGPNDVLGIETELVELRRASSRWRQRMYRADELLAVQEISVATTTVEGRPVRFPADLAEALRPHLVPE
jgi:acyl-CoA thioester hydrolase